MPSADAPTTVTVQLTAASVEALKSLAKRHLADTPTTSAYERNVAIALDALCPVGADAFAKRLAAAHGALTGAGGDADRAGEVVRHLEAWDRTRLRIDTGAIDTPDEWGFWVVDTDRSWDSSNHLYSTGLTCLGYGQSAGEAVAEARSSRRADYVDAIQDEDGLGSIVAIRMVDLHLVVDEAPASENAHGDR